MDHSHDFGGRDWPFDVPIDTATFSSKNVVHNGYPILTVAHDWGGDWQFLCGETSSPEDMAIVCFGCIFESHPFLAEFCDLPRGWMAWRDSVEESWQTEELPDEEEE